MSATHTYQMCHWGLGQIPNKRIVWYPKQPEGGKEGEDCRILINKVAGQTPMAPMLKCKA